MPLLHLMQYHCVIFFHHAHRHKRWDLKFLVLELITFPHHPTTTNILLSKQLSTTDETLSLMSKAHIHSITIQQQHGHGWRCDHLISDQTLRILWQVWVTSSYESVFPFPRYLALSLTRGFEKTKVASLKPRCIARLNLFGLGHGLLKPNAQDPLASLIDFFLWESTFSCPRYLSNN